MDVLQLVSCAFGKHKRDRSTAYLDGGLRRGKCRGCGTPMVKRHGGWMLDSKPPA